MTETPPTIPTEDTDPNYQSEEEPAPGADDPFYEVEPDDERD